MKLEPFDSEPTLITQSYSQEQLAQILPTPTTSPKRSRQNSEASMMSNYTEPETPRPKRTRKPTKMYDELPEPAAKKARGRPPKDELKEIDSNLPIEQQKRLKNNEASRRSRQSRKQRENGLDSELHILEMKNRQLLKDLQEQEMEERKWHRRVMRLAKL